MLIKRKGTHKQWSTTHLLQLSKEKGHTSNGQQHIYYNSQKKRDTQAMVNNPCITIVKRKGTHKQWSTTHLLQ
jgi:hypothetical protein